MTPQEIVLKAKRLGKKYHWLIFATGFVGFYAAWVALLRLIFLSCVTYFLMSSSVHPRFEDISEAMAANEVTLMGAAAILFALLLRWLNPLTVTTSEEIFTPQRFEEKFLPGFLHGSVLAMGVVLAFLISGIYRYLGFYIQFDEAPLALTGVLIRIIGVACLVYFEEFLFRHKIMRHLRRQLPDAYAAAVTALLYCCIKMLQFDLGLMQILTLFLISFSLGLRSVADGDFVHGAGFWAAILIVFHPLLSLPIFGDDFSGALLVRYSGTAVSGLSGAAGGAAATDVYGTTARFFTGGAGGPLSSFAFQLLLILDIGRGFFRTKKILLNLTPEQR